MAGLMPLRRLTVLLLGASLTACATSPAPRPPAAAAPPEASAPTLDPDASAFGLFLAGEAARDSGHLGAAATFIGRAAADEGEPAYLKAQAFNAALRAGDIGQAASLAPDGPDVDPTEIRLGLLVRGVEAMAEGKDVKAYAILTGPDMGYPFETAAMLLAPFAAAGAGDAAHALARPDLDGDAIPQLIADLDQAELEERLGKGEAAEASFKAITAGGDASGLATEDYGAYLERRGRWGEAQALFKARLEREPDDGPTIAALARAQKHERPPPVPSVRQGAAQALLVPAAYLIAQKEEGLALDYLRLALRLDPANDEAWLLVGDVLAPVDPEGARVAYGHVAPGSDDYVTAQGKLAWSYQNDGDHDEALKLARQTAAAAPDDREAQSDLADLLRANAQYAASAAVLTRLIDAPDAKPDWRLYYLRASAYNEIGDAEGTEADLQAALKLAPDEPELLNFQGYFWIDRGEHLKEALSMVQRAIDGEPQSGEIMDSLGWGYYRLGDYKTAVRKLEDAVTLDPGIPEVNDHLGDAYWRVGRRTEAEFQWRRVLTLDPDPRLKAKVEAKLASPQGPDAPSAPTPRASAQ